MGRNSTELGTKVMISSTMSMTTMGPQISLITFFRGVPEMPEVMNRHIPKGGVDRPSIMLKMMIRPKWMMFTSNCWATGHRMGIMTSWMEEDGMLNGETLEQVLVRLDYLFKGAIREALMRSASREQGLLPESKML